jgi:glycosyltransferase involved in cell wall biosynthesis
MKIFLFEPFFSGSHRQWAEGYQSHSAHEVTLMTLPGRHWKWRMFGGAPALAEQLSKQGERPDLILATDMLDLAGFLGQVRDLVHGVPVALYFHENQLTYPWSPADEDVKAQRDRHYAYLNFTSALAADAVFFNSYYHRTAFLEALPGFLRAFPDTRGLSQLPGLAAKSEVLHLGLPLSSVRGAARPAPGPPVILWNHRWEYDKGPVDFFQLLFRLQAEGLPFRLIVLGENYRGAPPVFAEAKARLAAHILHWGYAESRQEYARLLQQADLLPVTSRQDFFGGSVVEAIHAGCYPILPGRLAFPEHLPGADRQQYLYTTAEELYQKTKTLLQKGSVRAPSLLSDFVARYDWSILAGAYDQRFMQLIQQPSNRIRGY